MKCIAPIAIALAVLTAGTPALAVGLSETDYAYLAMQKIERNGAPVRDLSPKEMARLHSLIKDPRAANDPAALANRVNEALAEFLNHELWEREHPGQLRDAPKR